MLVFLESGFVSFLSSHCLVAANMLGEAGEGAGWDRWGWGEVHKGRGAPPWGAGEGEAPRRLAGSNHTPRTPPRTPPPAPRMQAEGRRAPHSWVEVGRAPRSREEAPRPPRLNRFSRPQLSPEEGPGHCSLHCSRGSSQPPRKTRQGDLLMRDKTDE